MEFGPEDRYPDLARIPTTPAEAAPMPPFGWAWEHSLPNLAEATPIHVLSKAEGPPFGRVWEPGLLESYWSGVGSFPPSVIARSKRQSNLMVEEIASPLRGSQ